MKKKRKSRLACEQAHFARRAAERFDWKVQESDLRGIVKRIQSGEGKFLRRQSNRVSIWQIDFQGRSFRAVYDKRTGTVVTILPIKEEGEGG